MEKSESKKYVRPVNGLGDDKQKEMFPPTKDQVREWTRRDLAAAGYFLQMLTKYPEVIDACADMMYDKIMANEHGRAIEAINMPAMKKKKA